MLLFSIVHSCWHSMSMILCVSRAKYKDYIYRVSVTYIVQEAPFCCNDTPEISNWGQMRWKWRKGPHQLQTMFISCMQTRYISIDFLSQNQSHGQQTKMQMCYTTSISDLIHSRLQSHAANVCLTKYIQCMCWKWKKGAKFNVCAYKTSCRSKGFMTCKSNPWIQFRKHNVDLFFFFFLLFFLFFHFLKHISPTDF